MDFKKGSYVVLNSMGEEEVLLVVKPANHTGLVQFQDKLENTFFSFGETYLRDAREEECFETKLPPEPKESPVSSTIRVGDKVRVRIDVTEPRGGWGRVTHKSVGRVVSNSYNRLFIVNFPEHPHWSGTVEEIEKILPTSPRRFLFKNGLVGEEVERDSPSFIFPSKEGYRLLLQSADYSRVSGGAFGEGYDSVRQLS